MIKRLFILFLLTSCYSVDRDCENFKMGEFEFTYKLNDTIQRSLFTRTLDYEIEEFNNVKINRREKTTNRKRLIKVVCRMSETLRHH